MTIDPAIPGVPVGVSGTDLYLNGASEAQTSYRVTLPAELSDELGQILGGDEPASSPSVTRAPSSASSTPCSSRPTRWRTGRPSRWSAPGTSSCGWWPARRPHGRGLAALPGLDRYSDSVQVPDLPVLFDRVIDDRVRRRGDHRDDRGPADAFPDGFGQALLYVEPTRTFPPASDEFWNNRPTLTWVQATHVGVDAFDDDDRLVVWTTDLRDGSPLGGAESSFGGDTVTTDADGLATVRARRLRGRRHHRHRRRAGRHAAERLVPGAGRPAPSATWRAGTSSTTAASTGRARPCGSRAGCAG